MEDNARLQAWVESHRELIASETAQAISGLSEDEQAHAEFIKFLIREGKLSDDVTLGDLGLEQPNLVVG